MIRQELDSIVLAQIQVNRQRRPFVAVLKEMTFEKADDDACYLLSDGVVDSAGLVGSDGVVSSSDDVLSSEVVSSELVSSGVVELLSCGLVGPSGSSSSGIECFGIIRFW